MQPGKKRGALDFEAWEWVNAKCCGLLWGKAENQKWELIVDESNLNPKSVAIRVLKFCEKVRKEHGVNEWWAHNGGKYDFIFLLQAAAALQKNVNAAVAAGRIVALKIDSINFFDSMAVVPSSLRNAAQDFELKSSKIFTEEDYATDVRSWSANRLENGCKADCTIVLELLDKVETLFKEHGGKLKATFSSAALTIVKTKVNIPQVPIDLNLVSKNAYCGGRVEVYNHAPKYNLGEWDINSSYPFSMCQTLPWAPKGFGKASNILNEISEGIIDATVTVSDCFLPPLPYKSDGNGLFFPTGSWRGWFTGVELRYAHSLGVKIKAHSAIEFTAEQPFTEYVTELYELRKISVGAKKNFLKLVLNGSYGKLGMNFERENLVIFKNETDAIKAIHSNPEGTFRPLSANNWRFLAQKIIKWATHIHYACAAYITSFSRVLLHKFAAQCKGLAYSDTDSIHAHWENKFSTGTQLGGLKLEIEKMSGKYFAPKIYELLYDDKKHFASKGFEVDEETFIKVIAGEVVTRETNRLAKRAMRFEATPAREVSTRTWHGLSPKRYAYNDGSTRPWTVAELENEDFKRMRSPLYEKNSHT